MLDINAIFDRICQQKGLKSDSALAEFLGVSKSAVNQSRTKGTANLWTVIEKCEGIDLNWLFRGEAPAASAELPLPDLILRVIDAGYRVEKKS